MTGIKKRLGSLLGPQGPAGTEAANARFDEIERKSDNAVTRVEHIETMAGLAPGEVTDAQTANLIQQPDSDTQDALRSVVIPKQTAPAEESAILGEELITDTGWTLGAGWSGDFASGFTHTPGTTEPLTWTPPFDVAGKRYLVEWEWDGDSTNQWVYAAYDVFFGGGSAGIIYQGGAPVNSSYSRAIQPLTDGDLVFEPWEAFEGRIHSISVREVTNTAVIGAGWINSIGTRVAELRFGDITAPNSLFFGLNSGRWNVTGHRNVGVGFEAMGANVSGFFNAALGYRALASNINGTRNAALGYQALAANVSGDRNVGIGPFALTRLTTGQRNVAIGVDTLWRLEEGSDNIGIGYLTLTELRNSDHNIAIGRYAMRHTHGAAGGSTQHNVAIGFEALGHVLGEGNIAIGRRAAASTAGRDYTVAIGDYALEHSNAAQQTAVGRNALRYVTGGRNTALGNNAGRGVEGQTTGTRNVLLGDNAGMGLTSGSNNTVVGPSAGPDLASGSNNILIGFGSTSSGDQSNRLNIGGLLVGDLETRQFGIGIGAASARLHIQAGGTAPGTAPLKLSRGQLLDTPEVGAFEFVSDRLYFTTSTGTRREIAFV